MGTLSRLKRRVFHIKIPNEARENLEKLLDRLSDSIKSYGGVIRLENESIRVEIYGDGSMIRNSWTRIRELMKEYKGIETERGVRSYSLKRIYKEIGLAIPSDVLVEVLKLRKYESEIINENVISTASFDEIIDIASNIKKALEDIKFIQATRTAKKLIITLSAFSGRATDDIIENGIKKGFLIEDEENGKISVISPWREALKELARVIGD